jgi:Na+/H+-dicarboxylate symporter
VRLQAPIVLQLLLGVAGGTGLGLLFGEQPYFAGYGNADLGTLGLAVIRILKALAIPLVFFAVMDAILKTPIRLRDAARLLAFCAMNVSFALTTGLLLMNGLRPGEHSGMPLSSSVSPAVSAPAATLDPLKNLTGLFSDNLIEPFARGGVISIVLLAVLAGAAMRRVKELQSPTGQEGHQALERIVEATLLTLMQMVSWVVKAVPFAVFACLAQVVGHTGLEVFRPLWRFAGVILLGMSLHALVYYPAIAWIIGRTPPGRFFRGAVDAILTGFSTNSSLATVPVTLRCLTERLGASPHSARLAACVGTNLNNDGITLYEAMATLFIAQAAGFSLGLGQQVAVMSAALLAAIGVAGVPEVGLVVLPLVLSAAGLPETVVTAALPLIVPIDWLLARCRSVVNVMGDMTVAIALERSAPVIAGVSPQPDARE